MAEEGIPSEQQFFGDINTRIRDIEEKQTLIRDRVLLIGKNLIEEKEDSLKEMREIKKTLFGLKEENLRMKQFLQRIGEQLQNTARKEELLILQRQFDLFRD